MTFQTVALLFLYIILAAGVSWFQYYFRTTARGRNVVLLAGLRFLSVLALLLLLINPVISRKSHEVQKALLPILTDNSSSMVALEADASAREVRRKLLESSAIAERFDVRDYLFADGLESNSELTFAGSQTNIDQVARNLRGIGRGKVFPTVIITDGNQTSGSDYPYSFTGANKVFPVIMGDTATVADLRITRLNVNKYAFLKNKFPVEVFVSYSGKSALLADFTITAGQSVVARQKVNLSPAQPGAVINVLLPADKIGLQVYKAQLSGATNEKNTYNNTKNFAVHVIDQRTEVALISVINHPDLGALKRSIESNSQRKATIIKPSQVRVSDYNVLVLYQPSAAFTPVFEQLKDAGNALIITGMNTDFSFLNRWQQHFNFSMSQQPEDYAAQFEPQFGLFASEDIGFSGMPPLQHPFGTISASQGMERMLVSRVRNIATNNPMLSFAESQGVRRAYLFGENIWKWRMHGYREKQSFEEFDRFVDRIIQYLSTDNRRQSLVVDYERFYNSGDEIMIGAQFFDKNYEFDPGARLSLAVTNRETKAAKNFDMLRATNSYRANLKGLQAGKYDFSVRESRSNSVQTGSFEVLEFDIEKQFVNPDVTRLNQLAAQTGGISYLPIQVDNLIARLLEDPAYTPIQRTLVKRSPLIDWIWLLMILAGSLTAEWFIRKYNGML